MLRTRVIPCLLLHNGGLVKTIGFSNPKYVGDPINAVRIFNEKEVDELILLDIDASHEKREPNYERIGDIVSEAFMPIAYGGGVRSVDQAQKLVSLGVEKIVVNSIAFSGWDVVAKMAARLGSSSTVVAVDAKKDWLGRYRVYNSCLKKVTEKDLVQHVREAVDAGAGEIFINDVVRDGTGKGFDITLIDKVCGAVNVPVIACGGAGQLEHFREAADARASAVAAGSMFVYMGKHRAVMINYPKQIELQRIFSNG